MNPVDCYIKRPKKYEKKVADDGSKYIEVVKYTEKEVACYIWNAGVEKIKTVEINKKKDAYMCQ